jgi:pilus assembly protein Flp/PilA
MPDLFSRFLNDASGATAVEYGLIVGFISGALIVALGMFGGSLTGAFTKISDALATVP